MKNANMIILCIIVYFLPTTLFTAEKTTNEELLKRLKQLEIEMELLKRENIKIRNRIRTEEYFAGLGKSSSFRATYSLGMDSYSVGVNFAFSISEKTNWIFGANYIRFEEHSSYVFGVFTGLLIKRIKIHDFAGLYIGPLIGLFIPDRSFKNAKVLEYFGVIVGIEFFVHKYRSFFLETVSGFIGIIQEYLIPGETSKRVTESGRELNLLAGTHIQIGARFYLK